MQERNLELLGASETLWVEWPKTMTLSLVLSLCMVDERSGRETQSRWVVLATDLYLVIPVMQWSRASATALFSGNRCNLVT